jgi:DNA-binding transcriptional regulator YiaG
MNRSQIKIRNRESAEDGCHEVRDRLRQNEAFLAKATEFFKHERYLIGELASDIRKSLNLSQDFMADKMGISGSTLSQLESGKLLWTTDKLNLWTRTIMDAKDGLFDKP